MRVQKITNTSFYVYMYVEENVLQTTNPTYLLYVCNYFSVNSVNSVHFYYYSVVVITEYQLFNSDMFAQVLSCYHGTPSRG